MIDVRATFSDRLVGIVSPRRMAQRVAARAALSVATGMSASAPTEPGGRIFGRGGYKGGHADRRQTRGWGARLRSANQDVLGDQRTVMARARDAAMNMPLATAAIERPITFTVGTGLMAMPEVDADRLGISEDEALALAAQIAADYDAYMSSTDPDAERTATGYELQEIVLRGVLESGDVLQLRVMPENQRGRRHETAWKLIEADRIVSPPGHVDGEPLKSGPGKGNVCAGGVEVDGYGAPIAYHVLKKAPSCFGSSRTGAAAADVVRIEAWGIDTNLVRAMLTFAKRRPEQFRGVSILAPVIEALKQVSDLTEAELFAAVLQGMLAIIYKSPGAQAMPEPIYDDTNVVAGESPYVGRGETVESNLRLEAGTILELDSEAGAEMKAPGRPNPAFDPFFMAIAKQIAAAIEVPLEVLLLSFEASYSASRGALEVFYLSVKKRREWLANKSETPRYEAWLWERVAKGFYSAFGRAGFLVDEAVREICSRVRFKGDGKISLDPGREAKALAEHEAHGWSTGAQITAELNGGDYDANVRRRVGEHRRFVEGGLPIPNAKGGGAEPAAAHRNSEEDQ